MSSTEQNPDLIQYIKLNKIGEGTFGKVYKVKETESGQIFAAKISRTALDINSKENMLSLSREVNINAGFDHPTVLKFISYSPNNFKNNPNPVIITEYATNGTLSRIIDLERHELSGHIWNDTKKLINIYGIASGMSYLHANNIIHRDLKPDNILMDDMLFPKISDFGLSKRLHSDKSMTSKSIAGFKGTPIYAAPETLKNDEQTKASDVYAFSLIMYELLTTKIPYEGLNMIRLYNEVVSGNRPPFDVPVEEPYKRLIERCWCQNPIDRLTFAQIVEELENNKDFITQSIKQDDFLDYVKFIKDYKKCFNDKKIIKLDNFIRNQGSETFKKIDIDRYTEEQQNQSFFGRFFKQEKLYPAKDLVELNEDCKYLVTQAENDSEKQFFIGTYLIEGKSGFPKKIDLGVKYLERSIAGKCIESVFYLSKMLIDGKLIPKDLNKAKKYLSRHLNSKDLRILILYARILLKESNYKESRKYFEMCAEERDPYSMYKYAQMLFCGYGGNKYIDDAILYFNLSKKGGFHKSGMYMEILSKIKQNSDINKLPTETQNFLVKQYMKYNKDEDESNILIIFKKIYMKYEDTQMLFSNKSLESGNFRIMMNYCQEITTEILFPSKQFKPILENVLRLNQKITICIVISGVNTISYKFGLDNKIIQIKIDNSVKKIESSSFKNCFALTKILIPSSVTKIGKFVFSGCNNLKEIVIPSSVKYIGSYAFNGCSSLEEIIIPSSLTSIEDNTFNCCDNLKKITIPSSVKYIKNHAFKRCLSLEKITIPFSIKSIDCDVFSFCRRLKEITLPSSLKYIECNAFCWCSSLEQIIIPSSVLSIGKEAFYHCHSMSHVSFQIPSAITSIQSSAFEMCSSLTEIVIPPSVDSIGHLAFNNCKKLKEVSILHSITNIEEDTFMGCSLLKNIPITCMKAESEIHFKADIIGRYNSGKSKIIRSYIDKAIQDNIFSNTIGIKNLIINGNKVILEIWEEKGLYKIYNTDFVIIVFDLTSFDSFDYSIKLFKEIRNEIESIPVVILGNKCDLNERNENLVHELEKFKSEYDAKYFEVSAKDNINIEEAFQYATVEVFNSYFS